MQQGNGWIVTGIIGAVCGAGIWAARNVMIHKNRASVSVIGEADESAAISPGGT